MIAVSGPTGVEREVIVRLRGHQYVYVGVTPPAMKRVHKYAANDWRGKLLNELKPFRVGYMQNEQNNTVKGVNMDHTDKTICYDQVCDGGDERIEIKESEAITLTREKLQKRCPDKGPFTDKQCIEEFLLIYGAWYKVD